MVLSPALRGIETDTLTGRSPGLRLYPTRHAFPFSVNSGVRVAFVADYSCEGSGGFAPRFPNTCGVPGCQMRTERKLDSDSTLNVIAQNRAHDPQSAGFCKEGGTGLSKPFERSYNLKPNIQNPKIIDAFSDHAKSGCCFNLVSKLSRLRLTRRKRSLPLPDRSTPVKSRHSRCIRRRSTSSTTQRARRRLRAAPFR